MDGERDRTSGSAAAARAAARRALFGDEPATSADERDPADLADLARGDDADRRYLEDRPPHHDRP